jgi:glycosyltransferase involved in cell wall biosynthesis
MITRDFLPKYSGIATHTNELVKSLRNLGVEVDVLKGRSDLRTMFLPLRHDFSSYDIVHVQSTPYSVFINHPHLVITVHSPVLTEFEYYPLFTQTKALFAYQCEKTSLKKAKHIIAVSNKTRNDMIEKYSVPEKKITTIHNGVDCERFKPNPATQWSTNRREIFMCSRLDKRKNIPEAFRALAKLNVSYECKIAGTGPIGSKLRDIAKGLNVNVKFLKRVPDDVLPKLYAESNIFLSTSSSEGFNLTVLEAMASGCAVVVSDIPSHNEFVKSLYNGLIYSNVDELCRFLNAPHYLLESLGSAARKTALDFSWDKVARKTIGIYEKVLSS